MIRLKQLLKEIHEDTKAAQLRRKKWRMVNEVSNQLEFEFSDDVFSRMNDLVKKLGGDLDSLVIREVNEAPVDFQNMPLADLEKFIQGTLDDTAKREKIKTALDSIVKSKGDEDIKRIHTAVSNKQKGKLSKDDLKKYNDFIQQHSKKTDKAAQDTKHTITVAIDRGVLDTVQDFIKEGEEALNWYNTINERVLKEFGESDGTLFLILFAILSPRNKLADNLDFAAKLYAAVKRDISNTESANALKSLLKSDMSPAEIVKLVSKSKKEARNEFVKEYGSSELPDIFKKWDSAKSLSKKETAIKDAFMDKYGKDMYTRTIQMMGEVDPNITKTAVFRRIAHVGMGMLSTYGNNLMKTLKLYVDKGFEFSKEDVINELQQYWKQTGELDKSNTPISAEKVFSFTLNLLDPNYESLKRWNPVTIDTWMLQFFYPDLKKEERESLLNKPGVYVYLARKVEELAKTVKTSDGQTVNALQMQAMIWVAIIRKVEKNPNYSVTFDQAVNAKVNSIKTKEEELNQISDFFQKASDVVENELKKKIEFIGSKKLKYED
jgi:hypothetical protein